MSQNYSMDSLPNECLTGILAHLPLSEQIRLRAVSSRWNAILTRFCSKRVSLKLFGTYQQAEDYCRELVYLNLQSSDHLALKPCSLSQNDDLVIESRCFSKSLCSLFLKLFPNLAHLTLYLTSDYQYPDLEFLTGALAPQLTGLALVGYVPPKSVSKLRTRLGAVIAQCPVLERLDFLFKLRLARNVNWDPTETRPFYTRSQIHALDELVAPLIGRIRSSEFRELGVNWTSNLSLDKLLGLVKQKRFPTSGQLTQLRLSAVEDSHLPYLCSTFPGLNSLDLEFANWPLISSLIPDLARLSNLSELRLAFIQIDDIAGTVQNSDEWTGKWATLPRLPSVRRLTLCEAGRFHGQHRGYYDYSEKFNGEQFCAILGTLFPNLERLEFRAETNYAQLLKGRIEPHLSLYFGALLKEFHFHAKIDYRDGFGRARERELIRRERMLGFLA